MYPNDHVATTLNDVVRPFNRLFIYLYVGYLIVTSGQIPALIGLAAAPLAVLIAQARIINRQAHELADCRQSSQHKNDN